VPANLKEASAASAANIEITFSVTISWPVKSNLFKLIFMVAHASRVLVSVSHRNNLWKGNLHAEGFLRSEKSAMARTPLPARETRALPKSALRFSEIDLVDFKSDKLFHAAALRRHGRIPDAQKWIDHCMHMRNAVQFNAPFG